MNKVDLDIRSLLTHLEVISSFVALYDFENAYKIYLNMRDLIWAMRENGDEHYYPDKVWDFNDSFLQKHKEIIDESHYGYYALYFNSDSRLKVWKNKDGFAKVYNEFNSSSRFKDYMLAAFPLNPDYSEFPYYENIYFKDLTNNHRKSFFTYHKSDSNHHNYTMGLAICLKFSERELVINQGEKKIAEIAKIISKNELQILNIEWHEYLEYLYQKIDSIKNHFDIKNDLIFRVKSEIYQDLNGFFKLREDWQCMTKSIFNLFEVLHEDLNYKDLSLSVLEKHFNEIHTEFVDLDDINNLITHLKNNEEKDARDLIHKTRNIISDYFSYGYSSFSGGCGCGESPCQCNNTEFC